MHKIDRTPFRARSTGPDVRSRYAVPVLARTLAASALLLALTGCAGTWQGVYAGASATADYVETTHERAWSEPLRVRVKECDALPDETTDQVLLCLGPYAANPDVLAALEKYDAAADVLAATLLATDPNGDQTQVLAAWADVLAAARELVALFPDGERFLKQLDALARKAGR